MTHMKFSKKLCFAVLLLIISALFMADGYAAEKYDIRLVNGKTLKGYYLLRSKDDPSILVAKTASTRIELKKSDIQEFTRAKNNNGFEYGSPLTPYNYTYRELLDTNPGTLHEMHSVMGGKISVLQDKSIRMLSNSIENMGDGPAGSPVQSVSSTKEFKKLTVKIELYSKFFDHISKALTVQRGIEASIKLDNNDYSSASELQRLIKNKVEMDMLD